ncbi:MAG TPA: sigma-70 family RNA polymerase sigma factor [Candidatus Polarisedimenticolia bacterium]|nr:sigma-70 family RNA polymerase sigma factor [Candidatus Polarisedimenticolia bacterium]
MQERRAPEDDVAAFLIGDRQTHEELRVAVSVVVRCFHFGAGANREDLIQEALYRTFLSLKNGSFRKEASLRTFAQRIAEFTCLEHLRRIQYRAEVAAPGIEEPSREASPENLLLRDEEHRRNLQRLAAMSPECRELFRLIFIERLAYAEVATRLGISETAVKLRVHRCRLSARDTGRPGRGRHLRSSAEEPRP